MKAWRAAALILTVWLGLLLPGPALATSLRFFGNGIDDIDRVKIPIDAPGTTRRADVGAGDFTLEWWMRALPGENPAGGGGCDTNDGWITGNIVFDRDVYNAGDHGDFGVSLKAGRVAFGAAVGSSGNTVCGVTDVADGAWHHVAVTRRASDGLLRVYVDGVLDAEGPGSPGNASYRDGRPTAYPGSDPFLVIGAEKHDAGSAYPSYSGWIDEVRLSTVLRYTGSGFTRPSGPFTPDASTAALYHLDEGAGDVVGDVSGGNSHGTRMYGGSPAGPEWSSESAPLDSVRRAVLEEVISGAGRAVAIAHAGDRLFVVDANGRILAYQVTPAGDVNPLSGVYLDIQDRVLAGGERGLLGLAFHPNHSSNGYFFVYYTAKANDSLGLKNGDLVIARYRAAPADSSTVVANTERILLTIEHWKHSNHNGGGMAFGPDGHLYAAVGDGGGGGDPLQSGQNRGTLLGKVLRLAVDVTEGPAPYYSVPPDNPFVDTPGMLPEIWAWGLRNPWRISFDRLTGDLFIADVGQGNREEVNLQPTGSAGGENYGWPRMEGKACFSPGSGCQTGSLVVPILDYGHNEGCSVTGGYRYRGSRVPALHGAYLFGDFCSKKIWIGIQGPGGTWSKQQILATNLSITTFGEDADGEIYVAHIGGTVHRLAPVRPRLTVTRSGGGGGTVNGPDGISCGTACSALYEPGQTVTLTVSLSETSWLAGWSGACGGTGDCVVPMYGDRSVTAIINPRPIFQFSAPGYSVSEGSGSATITVQRLGTTAGTATVGYAIEAGTATPPAGAGADFGGPGPGGLLTGTLTFTPGQSSKTVVIPIVKDARDESPETILLSLHQPTAGGVLGARRTAVLTIVDDDSVGALQFSQTAYSASEASGSFSVPVQRSGGGAEATVVWTITGGSALPDVDFVKPGGLLTGTLTFGASQTSAPIALTLLRQDDTLADGPRTIELTLSNPQPAGFATLGSKTVATLTIVDDEIVLQFSQPSYTASEGSASVTIPVVRTGRAGAASVAYSVGPPGSGVAATASALPNGCSLGADYQPVSGTLNFAAGDTSKSFTLKLCKDGLVDPAAKVVGLVLATPQPDGVAHLGPRAAVDLTINNVDAGGVLKWSAAGYSVNEGSPKVILTVNRSGGSAGSVQVDYVIAGGSATAPPAAGADFVDPAPSGPLRGTLAFGANVMSRTVEIFMVNDGAVEANESFTVTLQAAQGGASVGSPGVATVTIVDNDRLGTVQFSQPTTSVQEDLAAATLTVTRTGSTGGEASVAYQVTGDTASVDQTVTPLSGTVTFLAGQGSRSLPIKLVPDTNVDGNATLTVLLKTPLTGGLALGTPNPATVTLVDDEGTVQFAGATFTASEGSGSATITLARTGGTTKPTTVHFATGAAGDTAAAASTPGACSTGADYRPILDGALTFSPGQTSRTFTVSLCGDGVVETPSPETLTVRLVSVSAPATPGAQSTAVLQIQENDAEGTFRFSSPSYAVAEGASPATLTVLRTNGSAGAVTVPWSITGSAIQGVDYSGPASGSLPFAPGQTSASLPITILNDALVDGLRSVVVTLGTPSGSATLPSGMATLGSPGVATLGIGDNEPSVRFSTSTYVVNEGSTGVGVTVIRGGSTGSTVTVNVKTTSAGNAEGGSGPCGPGMDFTSATLPVTFNPGQTSKTVTLPLCTDTIVDGTETIGLALELAPVNPSATLGTPNTATVQLVENDVGGTVQFAAAASSVSESQGTASVLVTRTGGSASAVTVHWKVNGGTAVHGVDPVPGVDYMGETSGTVTFGEKQMSREIAIPVRYRPNAQGSRSVELLLDLAGGGAQLGGLTGATLWILDAD